MKLKTLTLRNFGPFVDEHTVPLDVEGLVAITGRNEVDLGADNNGAGKSTLLDALLWGLFGETGPRKETQASGGLKADDVINEEIGMDCIVTVVFTDDQDSPCRVERWRGAKSKDAHRKNKNGVRLDGRADEKDGGWHPLHDLDKDNVQAAIDEMLGMDHGTALKLLVRSQEDTYNFAQATPKERFGILTAIEGLDELDVIETNARERARAALNKAAEVEANIAGTRSTLDILRDDDMQEKADEWEQSRAVRVEYAFTSLRTLEAERQQLHEQASHRPGVEQQLAQIDAQLAQLIVPPDPPDLTQWRQRVQQLAIEEGGANARLSDVNKRIGLLQQTGTGVCSECGQSVPHQHVEQKRAQLEGETATLIQSVDAIRAQQAEATKSVAGWEATISEQRRGIHSAREEHTKARAEAAEHLRQIEFAERTLSVTRGIEEKQAAITAAQSEPNPYLERVASQAARIVELEAQLVTKEEEIVVLKSEAGLVDWWVRSIPSLKSWIFDNIVGEITQAANRWLGYFMGGTCWVSVESTMTTKGGKVKDQIGLRLFRWKASEGEWRERPFRKWSGGEKTRIKKALDWALSDRLAQRAHCNLSFLAVDEVEVGLDATGRESLLTALHALELEKQTVWVISQDPNLNAAATTTWCVIKDTDGSRIEVNDGERHQEKEAA